MGNLFRHVVEILTSLSVLISAATYYLSANKTWQLKHEPSVARAISIASWTLYLPTVVIMLANNALNGAPWQTFADYGLALVNTVFVMTVGIGWWVPGERSKGPWRLFMASLRGESKNLGALAKAITNPTGSRKIIDILTQIALIDDELEDREKSFVDVFAKTWDICIDWDEVIKRPRLPPEQRYGQLRRDTEEYLRLSPPKEQALQLADLITRLVNADGKVTETEALISTELNGLLENYAGKGGGVTYEVHLVPQSDAQTTAMSASFPQMPRRTLASGPIQVAATCYSSGYAEIVRKEYSALGFYAAVHSVEAVAIAAG